MAATGRSATSFGAHLAVLLLAQLAVGSAAIMARAGLDAGMSPLSLSTWRLTVASAIVALASTPVSGRKLHVAAPIPRVDRWRLTVAGILLGLHFAAWFASLQYIPVARSTLLVTSAPVWAGLAGRFILRQRVTRTFWIGLAVAFIGAYFVTRNGGGLNPAHLRTDVALGDALAVAGAIFVAGYLLLVQDLQEKLGTWRVVRWTYSAAAVALWPVLLHAEPLSTVLPRSSTAWLSALGMALVPQLIGHTALNWSLKQFTAGSVAAATLLEPVFAGALAWALLDERLSAPQIGGAILLLFGVGLALWPGRQRQEVKSTV
jgi:drug/metabolite transporter (DMT)-like permease